MSFEKDFFVEMKTMIILVVYFHKYARALMGHKGGVNQRVESKQKHNGNVAIVKQY